MIKVLFISVLFFLSTILAGETVKRDPDTAKKLSFFPGAGQIYNGDYLKGLTLFFSEAYSIYQISKFSKPLDGIVNVGKRNTFIWWAIGIYVYGIIDAHVESELSSFPDKNSLLDDSEE